MIHGKFVKEFRELDTVYTYGQFYISIIVRKKKKRMALNNYDIRSYLSQDPTNTPIIISPPK